MSDTVKVVLWRGEVGLPVEVALCHEAGDPSVGHRASFDINEVLFEGEPIETTWAERDDLHTQALDVLRMEERLPREYLAHLKEWNFLLAEYRAEYENE